MHLLLTIIIKLLDEYTFNNSSHSANLKINDIPYSRKYWRSLNLVVWPKMTFLTPLVDLNLAVWYSTYRHTYMHT